MAAIGWLTTGVAEAEIYFLGSRLDSTFWDALTVASGVRDEKTAVLTMAYNRIRLNSGFDIPSAPTVAQAEKLAMAQMELAYYLAEHLVDEDRRKGIQAQGVASAGIVQESYKAEALNETPFPPVVLDLLDDFKKADVPFYSIDIDRDENEAVDVDVTDV